MPFHFLGQHDLSRQPLVVPAIGEEFLFRRVREREVPRVVTKSGHAQDSPPVLKLVWLGQLGHGVPNLVRHVDRVADHVENAARQFHYAEGMLESLVRGRRVN